MAVHEVFFILDPDCAGDLWALSRRAHVWICSTAANEPRIRAVWAADTEEYSALLGVSSFELGDDPLATFYRYLGTIDEHHDEYSADVPWSAIHVLGLSAGDVSLERILDELSCESVSVAPGELGFTIRREPAPNVAP